MFRPVRLAVAHVLVLTVFAVEGALLHVHEFERESRSEFLQPRLHRLSLEGVLIPTLVLVALLRLGARRASLRVALDVREVLLLARVSVVASTPVAPVVLLGSGARFFAAFFAPFPCFFTVGSVGTSAVARCPVCGNRRPLRISKMYR